MNLRSLFPRRVPTISAGMMVKLDDGRIGIVDTVRQSPIIGAHGQPEQIDRAYVVGIENEFAAWVVLNEVAVIYGVAESATEAALSA